MRTRAAADLSSADGRIRGGAALVLLALLCRGVRAEHVGRRAGDLLGMAPLGETLGSRMITEQPARRGRVEGACDRSAAADRGRDAWDLERNPHPRPLPAYRERENDARRLRCVI